MAVAVEFRPMRWWDVERVAQIDAEVFDHTAWSQAAFWSELAGVPDTRLYLVATDGDEIVGFAGAAFGPDDADVQTIAVAASHQRQGLGRALMHQLLDECRRRRSQQLFLEVRHDNEPAITLYESLGFERISVRRNYYAPGQDAVIMRLRVSAHD